MKPTLDKNNANSGTKRGRAALKESLERLGAGRSILLDKRGVAIAGNKTLEQATKLGLPIKLIETDGSELVAVVRTDDQINMVWADPPYGINVVPNSGKLGNGSNKYAKVLGDESKDAAHKSFDVCKGFFNAISIFWGANHYASIVLDSPCWIVWDKTDGSSVSKADCELAWTNIDQPTRIFKHTWQGFNKDSERDEKRVHPTQKPVALCEWVFDKYGSKNDLIFDPFLGSGPSIIAAQKLNRKVYGFELSEKYCEVIIRRYERYTGETAVFVKNINL